MQTRAWHDGFLLTLEGTVKQATNNADPPADPYAPPAIEWEEVMEEAGVYAACAKDPFDPLSEGCFAFPKSGAS